jgi:chromosome segregation ATPase
MKNATEKSALLHRCSLIAAGFGLVIACATSAQVNEETEKRARIAAANMQDAVVVDCQLPGKLRRLGGMRTYLTPGRLTRTSAINCRTRGGEYTVGDLASGTLSLERWMTPAEDGDAEAQYYVARIYATGMDNVAVDYAQAAVWYEKAAEQGYNEAKQELGYLYEQGLGVEKDLLKALNLQRDASGLGEELDYAYKIADAQAVARQLAEQLNAANGALRDSQQALNETQEQLFAVRESVRRQESRMAALVANLEEARRAAANADDSARVDELEQEIAAVRSQLVQSQNAVSGLEQERDAVRAELAEQVAGDQATQLALNETQEQLSAAREAVRRLETQMASLVANLEETRRAAANAEDSARVAELEQEIAAVRSDLVQSQSAMLGLERERDAARAELAMQLAGGQAAQLELREIIARTENAEGAVQSLTLQLAEAQQRLIQSDEEIRELQTAYREQSQILAAERERNIAARAESESDAEAYIAAQQAEIAVREARIESLQAQIASLQSRLARAESTAVEDSLRQELEALRARYDNDVVALRHERDMLRQSHEVNNEQLEKLYNESARRLAAKDEELRAREREIATLSSESMQLRERVNELQSQQVRQSQQSGVLATQLQAQLAAARQHVASLTMALDQERAKKAAMEAELLSNQLRLEGQLKRYSEASAEEIQLLQADIDLAKSTIKRQELQIAALEKEARQSSQQLADLKDEAGELDPGQIQLASAMTVLGPATTVLEMARSNEEPNLGRYHALIIANQDYQYLDDLSTPIRDAMEIERLLVNRYGFSVTVLRNATDDQIMTTLHEFSNNMTEQDNLLIYYAGRGSTPDGPPDRAYWLGVDARPELRNTWLLAEHVSAKIREIQAKRVLVVTDSCFSRRSSQQVTMATRRGLDPERFKLLAGFRSRYVLTSGANVPVIDASGDRSHSLFAKSFLEVLRQNRNVLSGEMLSHEMINRVREKAIDPDRATPAYSSMSDTGHVSGDFFFVPMEEPLLVATRSPTPDSV